MKCRRVIGEGDVYWKIKGWGYFAVFFWLNCLYFLCFAWYHIGLEVVPPWHRAGIISFRSR